MKGELSMSRPAPESGAEGVSRAGWCMRIKKQNKADCGRS